ncbi:MULTISPECIES: MerR family transcriptional regulator [Halomonas]|uniref:MerR family transcriptional regulator n=1 Tax=Halomonas halophila TaxID=29573 RepID=A0ABQ0U7N6_9GAMM|nr:MULTISPECIES: MerR family transcriptional regulator [Halomonas]MDR5890453.1 MerR family transcriptional regulator [Halomonas salina]WJY07022.1 MerR family transcriptional regulator [Halomonas halophila]GEK74435.1 MerR family transcriptional regulator [Halomonas halophila]
MSDQANHPADAPLYPIREVSRLTGVNAVTLRAWERRYGLIQPKRTPKGHRLYAKDDIARVERILQWLNRGVPVSQVRELLEQPEIVEAPPPAAGDWGSQRQQLIKAVEALDLERLEALFNQALALYPVATCLDELWQPVLRELEERWDDRLGADLQRRTLEAFLRTRIGTRLYHANARAGGSTLLIVPLPDDGPLWGLLAALAAADRGYRVQWLDAALPPQELPLAVERFHATALLLASGRAERADLVRRQLPRLAEQLEVPVALCGPVARIRAADLDASGVELLGDDLSHAMTRLHSLTQAA